MRFTGQKPLDPLILVVFPPHNGDSSECTLWPPGELIDVRQTGDCLSYRPETVSRELARFQVALPQAIDKDRAMATAIIPEKQAELAKTIGANWQSDRLVVQQLRDYQTNIARASGLLQVG